MPMVTYDSKHEKHEPKCDKHEKREEMCQCPDTPQTHNHEFLGSTAVVSENGEEFHNHRFAGVTSEMKIVPGGHVHTFAGSTDFFDHHHEIGGTTGLQRPVGNGKHVHFASDTTTCDDGHDHDFQFATLIDAPLIFVV